jgi:phage repressor protein C with HTH and peptisase S24 domain
MLKHAEVWTAIDRLARQNGYSASALARESGLDPTTFNKSKRSTREGKLRWPSTQSISKILWTTDSSLGEFVLLIGDAESDGMYRNIPLLKFARAGGDGFFDDAGHPVGGSWDEIPFPSVGDPHAYALDVSGDSMEPVFRNGDTIIVSPGGSIRWGDRVVAKTTKGEIFAKQLRRKTARKLEFQSLNDSHEDRVLDIQNLEWIARIVWVSQ